MRQPGILGTFFPPPRVSDLNMHHGTCVTHASWCKPGSLTNGFLWSRWREKRSRHSQRTRKPQFYVCGKGPMVSTNPVIVGELSPPLLSDWLFDQNTYDNITARFCINEGILTFSLQAIILYNEYENYIKITSISPGVTVILLQGPKVLQWRKVQ